MPELVALTLVAAGTVLATGLGALPVLSLGLRVERLAPLLWGAAGGVMAIAAVVGLLLPAVEDGAAVSAAAGAGCGALLLGAARGALRRRRDLHVGTLRGADARRGILVAATMFAHSLPEGLAIGAAWGGGEDIGVFIAAAVAIQNVPEGMVTAVPLAEARLPARRIFWVAVATSAPQVPGALLAYAAVTSVQSVMGFSFGLAAGAMLALVAFEVLPAAAQRPRRGFGGFLAGGLAMAGLAALGGPG